MSTATVTCKCVFCKHVETFAPIPTEQPMCPKCYSPMYAVSASTDLIATAGKPEPMPLINEDYDGQ